MIRHRNAATIHETGSRLSDRALAELRRRLATSGLAKVAAQIGSSETTVGTLLSGGRVQACVAQRLEARLR